MSASKPTWSPAPALVTALLAAACQGPDFYRATRVEDMREAGSVHVAVLAVIPWERILDALQPNFYLTEGEALVAVLRDSRRVSEVARNAISLAGDYIDDEVGGSADTSTDIFAAPPIDSLTGFPVAQPPPVNLFDAYEGKGMMERTDAMLEYQTATALLQEIALLNHYLKDAAIPAGHRAYVVRLQVTLVPRRRNEPYDAYTTISFFSPDRAGPVEDLESIADLASGGEDLPPTTLREADLVAQAEDRGPQVLTLLVTDNLEASLESRALETMREFALDIASFGSSISRSLGFDAYQSTSTDQVYGRDLNSLQIVSKVAENTVRIRLGAMQQASADYAMVVRNYNVSLVVSVPEDAPGELSMVAHTELVDTDTGETLPGADPDQIAALFRNVLAENQLDVDLDTAEDLRLLVQQNQPRAFQTLLRKFVGEDHPAVFYWRLLWVDLVRLMVGSTWSSASFELRGHDQPQVELGATFFEQTPIIKDDPENGVSEVILSYIDLPEGVQIDPVLTSTLKGSKMSAPARSVQSDREAREVRITFDSISGMQLFEGEELDGLSLHLSWGDEVHEIPVFYRVKLNDQQN